MINPVLNSPQDNANNFFTSSPYVGEAEVATKAQQRLNDT